jgi:flagellar assembly protein FliH
MMSSSNPPMPPLHATAWALDELEVPDVFEMSVARSPEPDHAPPIDEGARAAEERTRLEAESYASGYRAAERAMASVGATERASALAALADATASVQLHAARWTANAEENIAAIAVTVARHIVEREVTIDPSIVRDLVQRALAQFPMDQQITVRLHPDDAAYCNGVGAVTDRPVKAHDVRVVADSHIVRGGCLVEGRERVIDGRVDTSLERAYRSIGQVQA